MIIKRYHIFQETTFFLYLNNPFKSHTLSQHTFVVGNKVNFGCGFICVCLRVYLYIICVCVYVYVCIYIYIYTYLCVCISVCMCIYIIPWEIFYITLL